MRSEPASTMTDNSPELQRRRSERIAVALAVQVSGIDAEGRPFFEETQTNVVSRHGGAILIRRELEPGQDVTLRNGLGMVADARVVGKVSPAGDVYGVALLDPTMDFWGVDFGPAGEENVFKAVLECSGCLNRQTVDLDEIEREVLAGGDCLALHCTQCHRTTIWRHARYETAPTAKPQEHPQADADAAVEKEPPEADKRRYPRLKVSLKACIRRGAEQDTVTVLDASRGGIRFRSAKQYAVGSVVEIAVPYTAGSGSNIFVEGTIAWRSAPDLWIEYGVKYRRN